MANLPTDTLVTVAELPKHLRISQSTLCNPMQEGKVHDQRVGWHWRLHRGMTRRERGQKS